MGFSLNTAFGFCEYADPECALRAMRLLNGFTLGSKDLVVSQFVAHLTSAPQRLFFCVSGDNVTHR